MSLNNLSRIILQKLVPQPIPCSVRLYSRWMHRKPAKVLLPFEPPSKVDLKKEKVIDLKLKNSKSSEKLTNTLQKPVVTGTTTTAFTPEKSNKIKHKRDELLKKRKFYLSQEKVFDDNNEIIYEKLKENDPWLSSVLVKVKSKREQNKSRQTLVEGWRLIVDGLDAKCILKYVVFSRAEDLINLRPFLPKTGVKLFKVPYKEIELWSNVETSPGIFGIFETPTATNVKRLSQPLPLLLICDNIRVPGNLGAILRAAVGVGCDKVVLSKGCVDVWDPKVIRSAAGAHFRLPIHHSVDWDEMSNYLEDDTSVFIADSNTNVMDDNIEDDRLDIAEGLHIPVVPYYGIEYGSLKHITLIVGGETEGISEDSYKLAATRRGVRLNIPMQRGVDSLNTGMATAVIAFEIRKQLIQAWTKIKQERQTGYVT